MMIWNILYAVKAFALNMEQVDVDPCGVVGGLSCGDPLAIVANIITDSLAAQIISLVLLTMIFVYAVILIINSRSDSARADAVMSYVNAFIGTTIALFAVNIASIVANVGTTGTTGSLIDLGAILGISNTVLGNVVEFIKAIAIGLLIMNLFIQGIQLIIATDDSAASEARKGLIRGILGVIVVMVADIIIYAIVPGGSSVFIAEIASIANFLIVVLAGLAAIGLVVAGIMYIVSIDEGLKDRANKLIITCIVTLIVTAAAFALLSTI